MFSMCRLEARLSIYTMELFRDHLRFLYSKAAQLRINTLRMIHKAQGGHTGSSLSAMEILVALYYGKLQEVPMMNYDAAKPGWDEQDYFVLSKAHAAPAWYALLADLGFFESAELDHFRQVGGLLQGHPLKKIPGVALSSGSPGQGFSSAVGLSMALKAERALNRVFVLTGDGELQEGLVWEAAMAAAHYRLDNLTVFVDVNGLQMDGPTRGVMGVESIADKFESFGWKTIPVRDGHDFEEIFYALERSFDVQRRPKVIVAHTIKGKGVSFAENNPYYHGVPFSDQEMREAIPQIESTLALLQKDS